MLDRDSGALIEKGSTTNDDGLRADENWDSERSCSGRILRIGVLESQDARDSEAKK